MYFAPSILQKRVINQILRVVRVFIFLVLIDNWQWQVLHLIRMLNLFKWRNSVSIITYTLHSHCTSLVTVRISTCSQPADVKPLSQEKIAKDRYIHKQRHNAKKKWTNRQTFITRHKETSNPVFQSQYIILQSHFTQRVLIGLLQYFTCEGYKVCKERNIFHIHTYSYTNTYVHALHSWHRGKATPLQAWTAPECSRRLRLPDFKTIGTRRW